MFFVLISCSFACGSNEHSEDDSAEDGYKTIKSKGDCVKIGVISDIHMNQDAIGVPRSPFENSPRYLKMACDYFSKQDIDLLLLTGDNVDYTSRGNYAELKRAFKEIYGTPEKAPAILYALGNHEFIGRANGQQIDVDVPEVYGLFRSYLKDWCIVDIWNGDTGNEKVSNSIQVCRVNDITVIGFSPDQMHDSYSAEVVDALEIILEDAAKNSNKPIILGMHIALDDYGVGGWSEVPRTGPPEKIMRIKKIPELLAKYPNLVCVTGHTHAPVLHGRNISQDSGYTNINVGPMTCVGPLPAEQITPDTGKSVYANYWTGDSQRIYNVDGAGEVYLHSFDDEPYDRQGHIHEGLLLTFEENELKVDRIDMNEGKPYDSAETYVIPYGITKENKDQYFNYKVLEAKEKAKNHPLTFDSDDKVELSAENGKITATFPSVLQYHDVECYQIIFYLNGEEYKTVYWLSDYFTNPKERAIYKVAIEPAKGADSAKYYSATVVPRDFFGNAFTGSSLTS